MITHKVSSIIIAVIAASLFAAVPLTAYAQTIPLPLLQINPINAASASNSDDDTVVQANTANIKQKADVDCEAKVSDDDKYQVGDNINTAANDCDTTQTATVAQANVNEDNDVQVAEATTCQAMGLVAGTNICDNVITIPPEEEDVFYCLSTDGVNLCFETLEECEESEAALIEVGASITSECQAFEEPPPGALLCTLTGANGFVSFECEPIPE